MRSYFITMLCLLLGLTFLPVQAQSTEGETVTYDTTFSMTLENRQTKTFFFEVNAQDVVDFVQVSGDFLSPFYSVYMPNGDLWLEESDTFINSTLPVSGTWKLVAKNICCDGTITREMMVRLVSTQAESITGAEDIAYLTPAALSGRYLQPIFKRIYISPISNLSLLHDSTLLIGEREDGMIIMSEDQATLDAALANPGFINKPAYGLRYLWAYTGSAMLPAAVSADIFDQYFSAFAGTTFEEPQKTALANRDWYFWRFGANSDNFTDYKQRTFAIRLSNGLFAAGYETDDGSKDQLDEFESMDLIESLGDGFPYLTDDQRGALGLPLSQVDAPKIEVDVALEQTFTANGFAFDYPAGSWQISTTTTSTDFGNQVVSGIMGLPAILLYESDTGEQAQIAFFLPASGGFFSASAWIDIMNLTGAQMLGANTEYSVEQVYVDDNLMSIVESSSDMSGRMVRFEVRMRNAKTVTMLVSGDSIDLIDRETLLAIAGSLRPE